MELLEQARKFFSGDIYATNTTGIMIDEVREDFARCSLHADERHKNADGVVMGGALYTLCDFTFAVAANAGKPRTVTLNGSINYLAPARGETLVAVTRCIKSGRSTCTYEVSVTDGDNNTAAVAVFTGFRRM